jgi:hypothetical protein
MNATDSQAPRNTEEQLVGRLAVASRILSGLLANPNVIGFNHNCGWSLVNCTDADIAGYALKLADELIAANNRIS